MLASRLEDPRRLADPRYSAEPELDGQRAQVHVHDHRTVHAFSHPGRGLIRLQGAPGCSNSTGPSRRRCSTRQSRRPTGVTCPSRC
jgi:hypothetical protein